MGPPSGSRDRRWTIGDFHCEYFSHSWSAKNRLEGDINKENHKHFGKIKISRPPKQNTKCQEIHNKCLIMTDCTLATKQHVSGSWRQSMNNRSNTHEYLCNVCSLDIWPWNNTQRKKRRMNINNNYICCLKDPPRVALAFKEIFMILLNLKTMLFCFK